MGQVFSFAMLLFLLATHVYFTFHLKFIQRKIPEGIRLSFDKKEAGEGTVSSYAALATALAATIGTGNIIGMSTAIAIGGPGAIFWCFITGVFGIATCYAESFLSVKYRIKGKDGTYRGGPMYVLSHVLKKKGLAVFFSIAAVLAAFGVGSSVQSHAIAAAICQQVKGVSPGKVGFAAAMLAGVVLIGGVKKIGKACTYLVPIMSLFYLSGCFYLLIKDAIYIPSALKVIVQSAFHSRPVIGGITGTAVMVGIRTGISKGLFTSEAGMGSIPMSAATAKTSSPEKEGLVSMTSVFWDTVVMCAITGLVIVCGMVKNPVAYQNIAADRLCFEAFTGLPFYGEWMLSISVVMFAFATILGWSYYGECGVRFLLGERGLKTFRVLYIVSIYLGTVMSLQMVWKIADVLNIFMALPNLICLWMLRKET